MTNRERENATLSFQKTCDRGSVEETFFPWSLTMDRFLKDGLPEDIANGSKDIINDSTVKLSGLEKYFNVAWGEGVMNFENHLGFDSVRRISLTLPFRKFDELIIEETDGYIVKRDIWGRRIKEYKNSNFRHECQNVITCKDDWKKLKEYGEQVLENFYTDENILKAYSHLKDGHDRGDYSIRMNIEGFFWTPKEMMGDEPFMYAYYDYPELMHDINETILKIYLEKLTKVLDILKVDVVYIMEDLSGKNGPMISPEIFDEFVGSYYKRLIPVLKGKGVRHIIVDTDGDFKKLIPNFIEAGVEGFLPMDVNAGMDIVEIRKEFPNLKFIGAFNKLCIAEGKEAIDKELERILPVIRQGGYIPGCDHQVPPSASLENYKYYIKKLKQAMVECGKDL